MPAEGDDPGRSLCPPVCGGLDVSQVRSPWERAKRESLADIYMLPRFQPHRVTPFGSVVEQLMAHYQVRARSLLLLWNNREAPLPVSSTRVPSWLQRTAGGRPAGIGAKQVIDSTERLNRRQNWLFEKLVPRPSRCQRASLWPGLHRAPRV